MAHSDPKAVEVARDLLAQEARVEFAPERWAVEKRHLIRVPYDWAPEDHRWVEVVLVRDRYSERRPALSLPDNLPKELEGLGSAVCPECFAIVGEESLADGYCWSCGEHV